RAALCPPGRHHRGCDAPARVRVGRVLVAGGGGLGCARAPRDLRRNGHLQTDGRPGARSMSARAQPGSWRPVLRMLRARWPGFGAAWMLTLAPAAPSLLQPWPIQILVDHVLGPVPAPPWLTAIRSWIPGASSVSGAAAWLAAVTLVIFALESALDVALTMR